MQEGIDKSDSNKYNTSEQTIAHMRNSILTLNISHQIRKQSVTALRSYILPIFSRSIRENRIVKSSTSKSQYRIRKLQSNIP